MQRCEQLATKSIVWANLQNCVSRISVFHLKVFADFQCLNINWVRKTIFFLVTSEQIYSTPFYFLNPALLILQYYFQFSWQQKKFLYFRIHLLQEGGPEPQCWATLQRESLRIKVVLAMPVLPIQSDTHNEVGDLAITLCCTYQHTTAP